MSLVDSKNPLKNHATACPFLIRAFIKQNELHKEEEFQNLRAPPGKEIELHAWMDATLGQITDLIKESEPTARSYGSKLSFGFVYPDKRGKNVKKDVGIVDPLRSGREEMKTLDELRYQVGDFLAVTVHTLGASSTSASKRKSTDTPVEERNGNTKNEKIEKSEKGEEEQKKEKEVKNPKEEHQGKEKQKEVDKMEEDGTKVEKEEIVKEENTQKEIMDTTEK